MANQIFKELSSPLNVQWEITPNCNYNCVHCYNYWRNKKNHAYYPDKIDAQLISKIVNELISNKVFQVVLTGGEPLLVIDQFFSYIKQLSSAGIRLSINTNLSLLTPLIVKKLKSVGIYNILTSLHSSDSATNDDITQSKQSLERTANGIKVAIDNGIIPAVNMVVSKKNLGHIFNTAKYVKRLGVRHFSASKAAKPLNCSNFDDYSLDTDDIKYMLKELARVRDELDLLINSLIVIPNCFLEQEEIKKCIKTERQCSAGKISCEIGFDGNIRACLHMSKGYGNISEGLNKAWKKMNEDWRTDKWLPKKCNKCAIKIICGGGCKVEALTHGGKLSAPDPLVDFTHIFTKRPSYSQEKTQTAFKNIQISSSIYFREEEFGGVITTNSFNFVSVNKKLYNFLLRKKAKNKEISTKELSSELNCSLKDAKDTIRYLLTKSLIVNYNISNGKRS